MPPSRMREREGERERGRGREREREREGERKERDHGGEKGRVSSETVIDTCHSWQCHGCPSRGMRLQEIGRIT